MDDPGSSPTWRQMNRDTTPEAEAVVLPAARDAGLWQMEMMED